MTRIELTAQSSIDSDQVIVIPPSRSQLFIAAKRGVQACFTALMMPRWISYRIARAVIGHQAFLSASESIARKPGLIGVYLRQAFYRSTLRRFGNDSYVGWSSVFSVVEAEIGQRVYIGRFCSIGFAAIEDEAMLADHVQILSGGHEHSNSDSAKPMQQQVQTYHQVRIGRGAWIGAGAVVMADVGEGAIVGAGAVVTSNIPPHTIAVGVPARIIKSTRELGNGRTQRAQLTKAEFAN